MDGILVIDKPEGPTSFDVVRKLRGALRIKKIGHTGTLDPMATGVLPVCLGEATKIAGYITESNKAYEAVVKLGQTTDTQDAMGNVLEDKPVPPLTREFIESVFAQFRGQFEQIPPMYSAIKVDGKRLYELARQGVTVERKPRLVTVHELSLSDFSSNQVRLSVRCSKGFFVRTLAHDIGQQMGCGAHLQSLRRIQSGPFSIAQSVSLDSVLSWARDSNLANLVQQKLVPWADALTEMNAVIISSSDEKKVRCGVPIEVQAQGLVRVLDSTGRILAIADVEKGRLKYRRVLVSNSDVVVAEG